MVGYNKDGWVVSYIRHKIVCWPVLYMFVFLLQGDINTGWNGTFYQFY